jgi:salicylate hydroxylase
VTSGGQGIGGDWQSGYPALVIGGGVCGLACALALLQRGIEVEVYEEMFNITKEGAGVQLSPNATRMLAHIGVLDEVITLATLTREKVVRLWNDGETHRIDGLARAGAPYLTIMRADLTAVLFNALRRHRLGAVRFGKRFVGLEQTSRSVIAKFGDGSTRRGSFIIGADGIRSNVRAALYPEDPFVSSGMIAWRGLIPSDKLPPELCLPIACNWIGPRGHLVHYPVQSGKQINIVAVTVGIDIPKDAWRLPSEPDPVRRHFADWHILVRQLLSAVEALSPWILMTRSTPSKWSKGRTILIGDACHPMLPFLAQGAGSALEDAYLLAKCVDAPININLAFEMFQRVREDRVRDLVEGSYLNSERFHSEDLADPARARQHLARWWNGDALADRYGWIYAYDVEAVRL